MATTTSRRRRGRVGIICCAAALVLSLAGCGAFSSSELPERPGNPSVANSDSENRFRPNRDVENDESETRYGRNRANFDDDEYAVEEPVQRRADRTDPDGNDQVAAIPDAPEPRDPPTPDDVLGLKADGLTSLLGAPYLVRRDEPSQIWQYRVDGCVLDVFLRRSAALSPHEVIYMEGRDSLGAEWPARDCLDSVFRRKQRVPTS